MDNWIMKTYIQQTQYSNICIKSEEEYVIESGLPVPDLIILSPPKKFLKSANRLGLKRFNNKQYYITNIKHSVLDPNYLQYYDYIAYRLKSDTENIIRLGFLRDIKNNILFIIGYGYIGRDINNVEININDIEEIYKLKIHINIKNVMPF